MKKSIICAHLLLAFFLSCNHAYSAETRATTVKSAAATQKTADKKLQADLKQLEASKKLAEAQAAELAKYLEVKEHAEPQMDVAAVRKLGAGMADIAMTSLFEMGFTQGNVFEGANSEHEFTVFFPLPVDALAQTGIIKLRYKTSALTGTVPNMRVEVNDHTVHSTPLAITPTISGLDIPINPEDLKSGHVKLTVKASIMPADVRCFDERTFALHYLQILPETRVELAGLTASNNTSLRGMWSLLPKNVSMSIPQKLTPEIMKVILQTASQLRVAGKEVNFVQLPKIGHLVVAERTELTQWLNSVPGVTQADFKSDSNIAVVHSSSKDYSNIIVLTEAASERDLQLLARDWRKVTLAGEYIDETPAGQNTATHRSFTLGEMGIIDEPKTITRTAEWKFFAGLPQVPGDMRIKSLHINVVAPPSKDRMDERLLLFVYVNSRS